MRILFLSPLFFGVPQRIKSKLEEGGVTVDFFDDHFSSSTAGKAVSRLFPSMVEIFAYNYYDKILESTKNFEYEYLFIIKGETVPKKFIEKFRRLHPNAKLYMYMQDSLENFPKVVRKLKWYDRVYTFDKSNSEKYNIEFRPLFFADEYTMRSSQPDYKYDICFIGTIHSDRYHLLKEVKLQNPKIREFFYMLVQAKAVYYVRRVVTDIFKGSKISEFKFTPMDHNDIVKITNQSKAVIDLQQPQQVGLTMRAIEMLGLEKKIITTNKHITEYDFYNPNNILLINRDELKISDEFLSRPYEPVDEKILERYSLKYFVDEIFDFKIFGMNHE